MYNILKRTWIVLSHLLTLHYHRDGNVSLNPRIDPGGAEGVRVCVHCFSCEQVVTGTMKFN
jgi:hypothetical protein